MPPKIKRRLQTRLPQRMLSWLARDAFSNIDPCTFATWYPTQATENQINCDIPPNYLQQLHVKTKWLFDYSAAMVQVRHANQITPE